MESSARVGFTVRLTSKMFAFVHYSQVRDFTMSAASVLSRDYGPSIVNIPSRSLVFGKAMLWPLSLFLRMKSGRLKADICPRVTKVR
jgi:hypothetical protein